MMTINMLNGRFGQEEYVLDDSVCFQQQYFEVKCENNVDSCGVKTTSLNKDGDYKSLIFDCDVCVPKTNLWISAGDIIFADEGASINSTAKIHNLETNLTNVNVRITGFNVNGAVVFTLWQTVSLIEQDTTHDVYVSADLNNVDFVRVQVDPDNAVDELFENDNYVVKKVFVPVVAYVSVKMDASYMEQRIEEFLGKHMTLSKLSEADVQIYVGVNNPDFSGYKKNWYIDSRGARWGYFNNYISYNDRTEGLPYNGLVARITEGSTTKIFIIGNQAEGVIAAVMKLLKEKKTVLNKNFLSQNISYYLAEEDLDAIYVYDYMNTEENRPVNGFNTDTFESIARHVLNDATYDLSIKRVLTYNDNTSLRLKHINSDLGPAYLEYSKVQPVVLSRGMHSDLFTWQDFGEELAGASGGKVRNVWFIELTGGPNTECASCPVYSFDDLTQDYWPVMNIIKDRGSQK